MEMTCMSNKKNGLLGFPLVHSFSKELHRYLGNSDYELFSVDENKFDLFLNKKDF